MKKQILITVTCGIGVIALFAGVKYFQISAAIAASASFASPPEAVTASKVEKKTWKRTLSAVATLSPVQGVTIRNEEPGTVVAIRFESGSQVEQGTVLVELDTSVEEAKLAAAQARLDWAKRALDRYKGAQKSAAISEDDLDKANTQFREADAEVRSIKATIAKKRIAAPFAGRTGIREVNVGQYLAPGTAVVPLVSFNPIYVDFSLPQQDVAVLATGQPVAVSVDAFSGRDFAGTITTVNPQVDATTRNIGVRATIANSGEVLRPGMFARVTVTLPQEDQVLVIPSTSISYAPYGNSVYVIEKMKDPAGKEFLGVRQQIVKLGEKRGELISIVNGLKAGEEVATSGVFKLRPGAAVLVNNVIEPGGSENPHPANT